MVGSCLAILARKYTVYSGHSPSQYRICNRRMSRRRGGLYGHNWFYVNFQADFPQIADAHINTLELFTVLEAARRWGHLWRGRHVRIRSDNSATVNSINKGTSRSTGFMWCLRQLHWLAVKHDFELSACHIKGELNYLADTVSRLHVPGQFQRFLKMIKPLSFVNCFYNMSYQSFLALQEASQTRKPCPEK